MGYDTTSVTKTTLASWDRMRARCRNNDKNYEHVSVCARWDSFGAFLQDMGLQPEGKTIDRINPHGNYEPGNCRWATMKEQAHNRRNTRFLTYITTGETRVASEWVKDSGYTKSTFYRYLDQGKFKHIFSEQCN